MEDDVSTTAAEQLDVVIVGAGISGIDAAYHVQTRCPGKTFAVLEARDSIGGTWDLFRYPGIRSDSDMYTLGFPFRPWTGDKAIADGADILAYLRDTAGHYGIDRKIRFRHRVEHAGWSSADSRCNLRVRDGSGKLVELACRFLFLCVGYYDYEAGYTPVFPGRERFNGPVVHPQRWRGDLDYADKRVVVIGSGATAVTLVPSLAQRATHVTMLQRSPTYIMSMPALDPVRRWTRWLPERTAATATRWKNLLLAFGFYHYCRRFPEHSKRLLVRAVEKRLAGGGEIADFTPSYKPWDQRMCLVPDGDLFRAMADGRASVVTDRIVSFTETGIALASGKHLVADIIITATGLEIRPFGKIALEVDGHVIDPSAHMIYRGMMVNDIPNFAFAAGYVNASWTLKCDLTSRYVCRLLNHMDERAYSHCFPMQPDPTVTPEDLVDFTSGYIRRGIGRFPRQGSVQPWRVYQNYALDFVALNLQRLEDSTMQFVRAPESRVRAPSTSVASAS
jgi:cation diffusion facilitator CzcD-associated flavoprotein CzcO